MRKIIALALSLVITLGAIGVSTKKTVKADTIGTAEMFVLNLYETCLERQPDEEGFEFYVSALYEGRMSATEVAGSFYFSEEYQNLNKTNREYICDLYQGMLGREYDVDGLMFWEEYYKLYYICIYSTDCAIFNCFASSEEFKNVCAELELEVGGEYITNERARKAPLEFLNNDKNIW